MAITFARARDIFYQALEQHATAEWPALLDSACGEDAGLRAEVERLLAAHWSLGSFMAQPAVNSSTVEMPANEPAGTVIGRYQLLEELGEGGMGIVYVAQQSEPVRRRVALKLIKPGMDTRQIVARFDAERQALALMDHPNIAKVFDGGSTEQGRPYFVMELVAGSPITAFCDAHKLAIPQRLELFAQVCRAVQHAHTKGIIHRDLKPSNVLVAVQEDAPVPKVIDFGVSKAVGQPLTDQTVFTQSAQVLGTPMYMSPEQAAGGQADIDTRSDVYSLGVLLYELLTGTTPFDPNTLRREGFDELRRLIREQEPPQPSQRLSTLAAQASTTVSQHRGLEAGRLGKLLRGELDWIVMKALEKDRTRRYQSAADLAEDIQRHLEHRPVEASPPSTWYRLRKYIRRNRAAITVSALILIVLLAATAVSTWQAFDAHQARGQVLKEWRRAESSLRDAKFARNQADKERKTAQASYKKARDTIKGLLEKVAKEDVAAIPGMRKLHVKLMDDAVRAYGDLIAISPNDAQNYYDRGQLRQWRRDPNFLADAERAVELDPDNIEYLCSLGTHMIQTRHTPSDFNRALSHLDKVVALDPDNADVVAGRAAAYARLDRPADARRELERLQQLPKVSAHAWANAGGICQDLGDDKLALFYSQRAIALGPKEPWCHIMRGRVLVAQGQTDAAISAFSEAIRLIPYINDYSVQWYDVHYFRAKAYERKGMDAEALEDWDAVLEISPNEFGVHRARAEAYVRLNKYEEALADWKAALDADPRSDATFLDIVRFFDAYDPESAGQLSPEALQLVDDLYQRLASHRSPYDKYWRWLQYKLGVLFNAHHDARAVKVLEPLVDLEKDLNFLSALDRSIPRMSLAKAYRYAKRYEEATKIWQDILDKIEALPVAEREPIMIKGYGQLAEVYEAWGKLDEASVWRRKLDSVWLRKLERVEQTKGETHLETAGALATVGIHFLKLERYADAEPLLRRCLAIREAQIPKDWLHYHAMSLLGGALCGQEKYAEAEPLLVEGFAGMEQRKVGILREGLHYHADAAERLAKFYDATLQLEKAQMWRDKAAELKPPK